MSEDQHCEMQPHCIVELFSGRVGWFTTSISASDPATGALHRAKIYEYSDMLVLG